MNENTNLPNRDHGGEEEGVLETAKTYSSKKSSRPGGQQLSLKATAKGGGMPNHATESEQTRPSKPENGENRADRISFLIEPE